MSNPIKERKALARITTNITHSALARIKQECTRRQSVEAAHIPMGKVINELVMKYLPPEAIDRKGPKVATGSREAAA